MIAAVHPETISESLGDALALAGVSVKTTDDLGSDSGTVREADVLIVELGLAPLRQLREVARIEEMLALPILLVIAKEHLAILESSGKNAASVFPPAVGARTMQSSPSSTASIASSWTGRSVANPSVFTI